MGNQPEKTTENTNPQIPSGATQPSVQPAIPSAPLTFWSIVWAIVVAFVIMGVTVGFIDLVRMWIDSPYASQP